MFSINSTFSFRFEACLDMGNPKCHGFYLLKAEKLQPIFSRASSHVERNVLSIFEKRRCTIIDISRRDSDQCLSTRQDVLGKVSGMGGVGSVNESSVASQVARDLVGTQHRAQPCFRPNRSSYNTSLSPTLAPISHNTKLAAGPALRNMNRSKFATNVPRASSVAL